uniref:HAT C-terminal dimerisation domain-containing protein n=1 Tax=Oryzias latipes TaxID=8090 RepID=A0A3B3H9P4_ORYLA
MVSIYLSILYTTQMRQKHCSSGIAVFYVVNSGAMCTCAKGSTQRLIVNSHCNDKIASMKRSNIKRHFDTHKKKKACQELLFRVEASQQQICVWTQQGDGNSASFAAALGIVRNGKPFTDGEFAKSFMLDVIIKRIKDILLSARTVQDRTIMMSNQIEATQLKDIIAVHFFSLTLDESTDVSNLCQFSGIARYVVGDTLREESLAVLPLKGTTRGEDLFQSSNKFTKEKNLTMDKLVSVCTDGAPCMVGKNRGFIALLREHEKRRILSFHCILHHEALFAQMCGEQLGEVMSLVVRVVNFIVARALNDRQFKALLDEVGNSYPGLLLHSNVRWLSRGKVLSRFADCLSEIQTFLERLRFTSNLLQSFKAHFGEFSERTLLFKFITHPHEYVSLSEILSFRPVASDLWVNRFKSMNEDLERLEQLVSQHKWQEMKKLQPADQLIFKTWNALPVTFFTLQRVSVAVLKIFGSTYACEQSFSHPKNIKTNLRSRLTEGSLNACMNCKNVHMSTCTQNR